MTKKAFVNAIVAELYILLVVGVLNFGAKVQIGKDNTFLAPLAMISLFTLSTAVMAYVFASQPLQMFLEGKKKQGVTLFVKTVGIFAILTVVLLGLMFSGILK
jgi:hypothetical protein